MSRGATEDLVSQLHHYEAALRLADVLSDPSPTISPGLAAELHRHFTEDQILDLGMCASFASGWQRFIEAFGIVPDRWTDGTVKPWDTAVPEAPAE